MKILITGATGFVGKNLLHFLKHHSEDACELNLRSKNWKTLLGDSKAIIHLAGKAHDLKRTSNPTAYFQVNTELTKQLFDNFLASDARDFIFMSSVKAAADTVEGEILFEDVAPNPATPYGQSKLQAEAYLLAHKLPQGKRVFILRPCMIHGPGNKGNLNLLYQVVKKGIPYPLGAFDNKRSFLSISNLFFVLQSILQDPTILGGIYQVADDDALSTTEVIHIIGQGIHKKVRILSPSPSIVRFMAKLGDHLRLPLNTERLDKMTENYVVSNKKIKQALGIQKFPVPASEGLLHTIHSFDKQI